MKVFKFGGASVKDADAVKNVATILERYPEDDMFIVVSAMAKTTNSLEKVVNTWFFGEDDSFSALKTVKEFHDDLLRELFSDTSHPVYKDVNDLFAEIEWIVEKPPTGTYDFEYDQIVSVGELVSSKIVSAYLNDHNLSCRWLDVRDIIKTDNTYRDARVDWEESQKNMDDLRKDMSFGKHKGNKVITQGFIGVTSENYTTTLGREGSDYSAAILAYLNNAGSVTIWKDVAGVLNADPKYFDECVKLNNISYHEAVELAYFGASIIHPKTIKPLQNKNIPLHVKSFFAPGDPGTVINENTSSDSLIPSFIFKVNQVLISIIPRDYSFIVEENLSEIFSRFANHRVKIHLMENSAISFSVCADNHPRRLKELLDELRKKYRVLYNQNLEMLTIRHYNQATIEKLCAGKKVLLEQRTRHTACIVMK